jgi:hypothetical protein
METFSQREQPRAQRREAPSPDVWVFPGGRRVLG